MKKNSWPKKGLNRRDWRRQNILKMSELSSKGSTKSTLRRKKQCDSLRINASREKKKD